MEGPTTRWTDEKKGTEEVTGYYTDKKQEKRTAQQTRSCLLFRLCSFSAESWQHVTSWCWGALFIRDCGNSISYQMMDKMDNRDKINDKIRLDKIRLQCWWFGWHVLEWYVRPSCPNYSSTYPRKMPRRDDMEQRNCLLQRCSVSYLVKSVHWLSIVVSLMSSRVTLQTPDLTNDEVQSKGYIHFSTTYLRRRS